MVRYETSGLARLLRSHYGKQPALRLDSFGAANRARVDPAVDRADRHERLRDRKRRMLLHLA